MTERSTGLRQGIIGVILLAGLLALPALAQVTGGAPVIQTEPAAAAASASVAMHGVVFPNGVPAAVWFEYGTGPELGSASPVKQIGTEFQSTRVIFYLYRVQPGATYYFRMAGRNAYGEARGETLSVNVPVSGAAGQAPYPDNVSPPPAGSASGSHFFYRSWPYLGWLQPASSTISGAVSLAASVDNPNPKPGDVFTYTLTYRNGSSARVSQAHLRVTVPAELEFLGANPAPAVSGDQLDFDLGTLNSGVQEALSVPFRVRQSVQSGSSVTISARLDYMEGAASRSADANFTILAGQASQAAAVSSVLSPNVPWYILVIFGLLALIVILMVYIGYRYFRARRSFKA